MKVMKYFLIIIATLFFQISCNKNNEATLEKNEELSSGIDLATRIEFYKRVGIVRNKILEQVRATRGRVIVKGCRVIPRVNEYTGLFFESGSSHQAKARESIEQNENIPDPLIRSIAFGDIKAVRCLLEASHDPNVGGNAGHPLRVSNVEDNEALLASLPFVRFSDAVIMASVYNFPEILKLLIKHGAYVNSRHVPIAHIAGILGYREVESILKANGAK